MNPEIRNVLLSRVYDVAKVTPTDFAPLISEDIGCKTYLKREDIQPVHSFKLRGAYNKIVNLTDEQKAKGVITASAGNHAQGVALAAKKLAIPALIVMPITTPEIKINAVKNLGAKINLHGDNYSETAEYAKKLVKETGMIYIHPFDDPLVIAGQATVGKEIIEQIPAVTHIFVPVGGGGLLAGIAEYVKILHPTIRVIGVEPKDSNAMQQSLKTNERVKLKHVGIFADGVAVKQVGVNTFNIAKKYVDKVITVDNDQICAAIKHIFEETRNIVEPAGALGVAGMYKYAKDHDINGAVMVAINSGANMTFERLQFIAERTSFGSDKEALYAIELAEKPGSLKSLCDKVIGNHNISQFAYRLQTREKATILVGVSVRNADDKQKFEHKLSLNNYKFLEATNNDLAKQHIRHMIGGKSATAIDEHFYQISFPERPGALADFLKAVSGSFNISLFHYRGQGSDSGFVLIGFEAKDYKSLEHILTATKYGWHKIDRSEILNIFI